jgi:ribosomal protein S18 acetylase RimI-like enzyme
MKVSFKRLLIIFYFGSLQTIFCFGANLNAVIKPLPTTQKVLDKNRILNFYKQEQFSFEIVDENNNVIAVVEFIKGADKGYVAWLNVDEKYRRQGMGQMLLKNACKKLEELGCKEVYIEVMSGKNNIPAVTLYQKEGFKGDPDDYMKKDLCPQIN